MSEIVQQEDIYIYIHFQIIQFPERFIQNF